MLIINSKLPTTNIKVAKILPELIQGFIYHNLPESEHIGYRHKKTGKIFKKTNFDFSLRGLNLRIRFTSYEPKFEELIAMEILKNGLKLGEIYLLDTNISISSHRVNELEGKSVLLKGYAACAIQGLLGYKIYLEPQDSRHLEMMKTNALQRFETIKGYEYDGEFELILKWQNLYKPVLFYYGNNNAPMRAWQAIWEIKASSEMINLILDTGVGSGCMSVGTGFLEIVKEN
ncbi:CRISPR-associated endoribonuclease Cas6 [Campylobacter sp. RM16187]|uniref:CRISPR-associated endoribonuclease Cas6 n=1 Tax=Campylobacter sp. RM16187 TaxID=1660063 RepID=UPI0021B5082B|nr:CRISPR-associated endoribonuclease Cas6 [Campylobacter sp. RM16187]QKG30219.1 CRISPR/Cas system-associated RAMP protein Cas6, type I-B/HMARI [Campylobacter sp. RM16187]